MSFISLIACGAPEPTLSVLSDLPEYSPIPQISSTSTLLTGPAVSDIESAYPDDTEGAQAKRIGRIWQKLKSTTLADWGFYALFLGAVVLLFACSVLFSRALNVVSIYVGGHILHYAAPIRATFHHPAFMRVVFTGSAVVDALTVFATIGAVVLAERRYGSDSSASEWALWGTPSLGMIVSSAIATSVGMAVVPQEFAPEGLSAIQALAAGSLGTGIVGIPMFILVVAYLIAP